MIFGVVMRQLMNRLKENDHHENEDGENRNDLFSFGIHKRKGTV